MFWSILTAAEGTETTGIDIEEITEAAADFTQEAVKNPSLIAEYAKKVAPDVLSFLIHVVVCLVVYLIFTRIIKGLVKLVRKAMNKKGTEVSVTNFVCSLMHYALLFLLVMVLLGTFGLSGTLVAILGSVGLTVGLALQGSLANFAGGVLIILLKPFQVGDYIESKASGCEGSVTDISLFYTKLCTVDNRLVVLPNGALSNSNIVNYNKLGTRMLNLTFDISYGSDLALAKAILTEIANKDEAVLQEEAKTVFVSELRDSSVRLGFRVYVKAADYWTTMWRITENVKLAFDERGISIPFPQLDVHTK